MNITKGVELLKQFESFAKTKPGKPNLAHAYLDMVGVKTIAWGFTKGVEMGDTMTRAEADIRLAQELDEEYVQPILAACKVVPNEHQLGAMACLAWNIGINGFKKSTVLKCHNRSDFNAAARAFSLWNKAGGKTVAGLTRRRAAEAVLYLTLIEGEEPEPMPQMVEAETSVAKSPIITGTVVTTTLAAGAEAARSFEAIRDSLGVWMPYVALAAIVLVAGWVIWTRVVQRKKGWA